MKKTTSIEHATSWLSKSVKKVGLKLAYAALLLIYAYRRKDTPRWAKTVVLGALAYLLSPIDTIPDLTPLIGYSDDFSMIILSLGTIAAYVNDEVRYNARQRLDKWFPEYDEAVIIEIEEKLD